MTKYTHTLMFALLFTAMICLPGFAEAKKVTTWENGLEVTVDIWPEKIVIGEPIWMTVSVFNEEGSKLENVQAAYKFAEGGDLKVMIKKPGQLPVRYEGTDAPNLFIKDVFSLERGRRNTRDMMIYFDKSSPTGLAFDKEGFYSLSASVQITFATSGKILTADTGWVNIRVVTPSVGEKQALDKLTSKEVIFALQQHISPETSGVVENLQEYLNSYPNGPMAPVATVTLLNTYATVGDNLKRAAEYGLDFLLKWPKNNLEDDVIFMLSLIANQQNDGTLARAWFFYLYDTNPGYRLFNQNQKLSNQLYYGPASVSDKRRWYLYDQPWDFEPPVQTPGM